MKADDIRRIAAAHKASNVAVFGSVARGEDTADSDVDLLMDFAGGTTFFDLFYLEAELVEFLGCKIDVVSRGALKPRDERIRAEAIAL